MLVFFLARLVRRAKWSIAITLLPASALYVSTFFSKTTGPSSTKLGSGYPWWWNIIVSYGYSFTGYCNIKPSQRYRLLWASSFFSLTSILSFVVFSGEFILPQDKEIFQGLIIVCSCIYLLLFVYRATLMIWTCCHFNIYPPSTVSDVLFPMCH